MIKGLRPLVVFCADTEASRAWYERAGFEGHAWAFAQRG